MFALLLFCNLLLAAATSASASQRCESVAHDDKLKFSLVRRSQRSQQKIIDLENKQTLEACVQLAKRVRGLALNYAPTAQTLHSQEDENEGDSLHLNSSFSVFRFNYSRTRSRQHFWQQPAEFFNCHVLQCPENETFRSMVNDSRFNYYSLYGQEIGDVSSKYTCLPEVGLFHVHVPAEVYTNARLICANCSTFSGSLAHVASIRRTSGLSQLLATHKKRVHLAYVGLQFNQSNTQLQEYLNMENESLNCFLYRAWAPGHPKMSGNVSNINCVALTSRGTWLTVACNRKLPFICEIYASEPQAIATENCGFRRQQCPEHLPSN